MLCPGCDRIIWWWQPSDESAPHFSSQVDPDRLRKLDLDSLESVELVISLGEDIGPDDDARQFNSLDDIIAYMERKRSDR